jgi:hypothetical protein
MRLAPGVLGLCVVLTLATLTMVSAPVRAAVPGDFVVFSCAHGAVSLSGLQVCHDQTFADVGVCGNSVDCQYTLSAQMDTGYAFSSWTSSGDSCLGGYPSCGTGSSSNPTLYWGGGGSGRYAGTLVLNSVIGGLLSAPYSSTWQAVADSATGVGQWNQFVGPTEDTSDGYVFIDTGAQAYGLGAANIYDEGGFYVQTFSPTVGGTYDLQATWGGVYEASASTSICILGASYAAGYGTFYMNVLDLTTGEYVFGNYLSSTLYSFDYACGVSWGANNPTVWDVIGSTAGLASGHTYQFITYLEVYAEASAVGLAGASSVGNFGSDTNSAILVNAEWTLT